MLLAAFALIGASVWLTRIVTFVGKNSDVLLSMVSFSTTTSRESLSPSISVGQKDLDIGTFAEIEIPFEPGKNCRVHDNAFDARKCVYF